MAVTQSCDHDDDDLEITQERKKSSDKEKKKRKQLVKFVLESCKTKDLFFETMLGMIPRISFSLYNHILSIGVKDLPVKDLKVELRNRYLRFNGNEAILRKRLLEYL